MKTMTRVLGVLLFVLAALTLSSCQKENQGLPTSNVTWNLTLPESASDGTVSETKAVFTNMNTGTTYNATVSSATKATVVSVSATVPEGLYNISVEGKVTYTADDGNALTTGFRAYKESVTISGETVAWPETQASFYNPSNGFVISEVYFAGSSTATGDQYMDDQYIKICNNSDQVLYADSLAILLSEFNPQLKREYRPDIMKDYFSVSTVLMIPGSGKDHPVQPGAELVIAMNGINHKEYNPTSPDLSKADFEVYDYTGGDQYPDVDGTTVPNVEIWTTFSATVTGLHVNGLETWALARMEGTKDEFLTNNAYTAEYTFTFGEHSFEMSTDCFKVPNAWIVDAVNGSTPDGHEWLVIDASLDAGYTWCAEYLGDKNRYNTAAVRKKAANGKLQDTNNSTNDFTPHATPSLL